MNDKKWICIHCHAPADKRLLQDGRERPVCERCLPYKSTVTCITSMISGFPRLHPVPVPAGLIFMSKRIRWPGGYDVDTKANISVYVDILGANGVVTTHKDVWHNNA